MRKPKRTAYVSNHWAMIPDEQHPTLLRKVPTRVVFFDCPVCKQPAGYRCLSRSSGNTVTLPHSDRGYGNVVTFEERVLKIARLVASKAFDAVVLLEVRAAVKDEEVAMADLQVKGLRPVDERWQRMYSVYEACDKAGLAPPQEVLDFFEGVYFRCIERRGIEVEIREAVSEYVSGRDDATDGFEVDLSKLPADVTVLRFTASY